MLSTIARGRDKVLQVGHGTLCGTLCSAAKRKPDIVLVLLENFRRWQVLDETWTFQRRKGYEGK